MEKEFFKDLPDTSTPINASRLNNLLNGKESMGDITVESIKSKNLFTGFVIGIGLNPTTGAQTTSSVSATSGFIPVDFNENERYYLSGLSDNLYSLVAAYNSNYEFLGRTSGAARTKTLLTSSSFTNGTSQGTGEIAYLRVSQYEAEETSATIQDVVNLQVQLEVGDEETSYSPFVDFVIEVGENENGTWEKWASGKMICYGNKTIDEGVACTTNWGGLYQGIVNDLITYPKVFKEVKHVEITVIPTTSAAFWTMMASRQYLTTGYSSLYFMRPTSATVYPFISWLAIGKWK